jgi:ABC-2 type transport system ATP-binding protein
MKQRLAIAAALLGDPQILVLDEPTNGLDPVGIAEIRELIIELSKKGHTIIMASHLLDEVEKVCTHVAILKTGTLVSSGSVDDVLVDEDMIEVAAADMPQLKAILSDYPGKNSLAINENTVQINFPKGTARPEEINQYCFNKGIVLQQLIIKKKRLEEKFFELTNN